MYGPVRTVVWADGRANPPSDPIRADAWRRRLGANGKDVLFRAMLPSMVDSLRVTLGWCWTYLLIAEIVASNSGIGYELWTARRYGKTPEVFAGILTIGIIGLASDQLIRAAHRRAFRYLA